jgi:hypothetical protein
MDFAELLTIKPADKINKIICGGGDVSHSTNKVTKEQVEIALTGVTASAKYLSFIFSRLFRKFGTIEFCTAKLVKAARTAPSNELKEAIREITKGTFKGILTREHILTIATVIYRWFLDETRYPIIWGAEQAAKTMVYSAIFLILPCIEKLLRGRLILPVIFSANRNNITLSARGELTALLALYGEMELVINGERISLNYVREDILNENIARCYGGKTRNWDSVVFNREPYAIKEFVQKVVEGNKHQDCTLAIFIDEVQNGSAIDGQMDDFITFLKNLQIETQAQQLKVS